MDLQLISLIIFFGILLILGIKNYNSIKTFSDYAISKNYFSTPVIIATIVASFIGGGTIFGVAEDVFSKGPLYIIPIFGFSLQLLLTGIIFAPKVIKYNQVLTLGDILRKYYGAKIQILTGLLWILFSIGVVAISTKTLGKTFSYILNFNDTINSIICGTIIIIYCILGGIRGVVKTDIIQFLIMFFAIPLTLYIGMKNLNYPISDFFNYSKYPEFHSNKYEIIFMFIGFLLGDALIPPVMQRLMMGKDKNQARIAMVSSALLIIPLILAAAGLGSLALFNNPNLDSAKIVPYLFNNFLPTEIFKFIGILGLICAIMSTSDSYLNSSSVILVNDVVIATLGRKRIPENKKILFAQTATLVIGIIGILMSIYVDNLIQALLSVYKLWGPIMVIPIIFTLLDIRLGSKTIFIPIIIGALTVLYWDYNQLEKIYHFSSLIPGIALNLISYLVVYFLVPKSKE